MDEKPKTVAPAPPDPFITQVELLAEAAVATTAEAKQLRHDVKKERQLFMAVLLLLLAIICQQAWSDRQNNRQSTAARRDIIQTLNLIEDCVSSEKADSDCQRRGNESTGKALKAIADANEALIITAFQCARDPQNVDNAALELCITSQAGQVTK